MASLSDVFNSYDGQQALGLLAAAGARSDGAGFGQRLMEGLSQGDKWKQQQQAQALQKIQMDNYLSEIEQRKAATAKANQMQEMALRKQQALPSLWSGGSAAISPLAGDAESGILPSAGRAAVPGTFDTMRALQQGYTPDEIQKLVALKDVGQQEVARTIKGMQGGREVEQQVDKFGRPVGQSMEQFRAPIMQDLGGNVSALDPYSLQPRATLNKTMSFADRNAAGNLSIAQQRLGMDRENQDKPVWNETLGGFVDPRQRVVRPAMDAQGNPIASAGGKMTEDQAKASGWLVQAENAFGNMNRATAKNPDAAKPGFNDVLAAIPSFGFTSGVANMMRGDTRQQFLQGASSLSEALLRAATGAGVNKDEALQKVRELTPQIGDDEATIKQKKDAIPLYIESLKMRSGPGAKKVENIMGQTAGPTSDPLGLFK